MKKNIQLALSHERASFEIHYNWTLAHMPASFFEEFSDDQVMTIVHNLMGFAVQGEFVQIHFSDCSIVVCLDGPLADLKILKQYVHFGILSYQTFISNSSLPGFDSNEKIRVAVIYYTKVVDEDSKGESPLSFDDLRQIYVNVLARMPEFTEKDFDSAIMSMNSRFLKVLTRDRLEQIVEMYFRSKTRDHLQYDIRYLRDWKLDHPQGPSMQIVLAWKNTHKYQFLYKLAKLVHRHNLVMKKVNATYIDPYSSDNILLMSLSVHGKNNTSAWEATDIKDFLQELATLKYFEDADAIELKFVNTFLVTGNEGNLLRTVLDLTHQLILHADANMYSKDSIIEAATYHPDLTVKMIESFHCKFDPKIACLKQFEVLKKLFLKMIDEIDTGNLSQDTKRKNIFLSMFSVVDYTLKTNFYKNNKSAIALRIDPSILTALFYDYREKFPELPYGIFFIKGKSFISFQVRFKDLSRGGLRTIFPKKPEQANWERLNIFSECYNLAYTQQKKNKDIPEGGSKVVIFIEPFADLSFETEIYQTELVDAGLSADQVQTKITQYHGGQRNAYLYSSQRSFVYTLLSLVNMHEDGSLKAKDIVDYHGRPEYIYLGPDENMHNCMIEWIADYSVRVGYILGAAFISSKPKYGFNHKEYGVTSYTVNVYMENILRYMNIDPDKDPFTVKISGGPDGDVAGNQIYNLYKFYPHTAKLLAITDVSGTIYDPHGLDLKELAHLFKQEKPLRFYPASKLHDGGFLLDIDTTKDKSQYQVETLCLKMAGSKLEEHWLLGNETQHLYSHHLHQVEVDVFIPGGGRPRTLNINNYRNYLNAEGMPTSKAIVEGANLYLTSEARSALEGLGCLIIKDSSANKGGVMTSSLEVMCSLLMKNEEFLKDKDELMVDVLSFLKEKSQNEASLLLKSHDELKSPLTQLSDEISEKINGYTYQILDHLENIELSSSLSDPLMITLVEYLLPIFQRKYRDRILTSIPQMHKKAIIACAIAQKIVYTRGLSWRPSIVDILPLIIGPR